MSAQQQLQVQLGSAHRLWCGLFVSDVPRCTCGQLTVEQLVGWWAAQGRSAHARAYHGDAPRGIFATPSTSPQSKGA